MPQIFPDSSSASPTIQNLAPSGTQFATNAVAMRPPGSSSSRTGTPGSKGRDSRTPQPSALTTSVWHCSENWMAGSRQVTRRGICARMRVLRRSASYDLALDSMLRCQNFTSEMLTNWNSSAQKWHQSNHGAVTQNYCLNARYSRQCRWLKGMVGNQQNTVTRKLIHKLFCIMLGNFYINLKFTTYLMGHDFGQRSASVRSLPDCCRYFVQREERGVHRGQNHHFPP